MAPLRTMLARVASTALDRLLRGARRGADRRPPKSPPDDRQDSPGRSGPNATVEVDPGTIGAVRMTYSPQTDGAPDPGEVIWTWVPFEENDGRGKDRPVLLVAAERAGTVLGVQLTSKRHDGADFVAVGAGSWDSEHRPSWANLDRVIRVHPDGMRREAAAVPHKAFDAVTERLAQRYGWSSVDR
jgi:hypothetical protein